MGSSLLKGLHCGSYLVIMLAILLAFCGTATHANNEKPNSSGDPTFQQDDCSMCPQSVSVDDASVKEAAQAAVQGISESQGLKKGKLTLERIVEARKQNLEGTNFIMYLQLRMGEQTGVFSVVVFRDAKGSMELTFQEQIPASEEANILKTSNKESKDTTNKKGNMNLEEELDDDDEYDMLVLQENSSE